MTLGGFRELVIYLKSERVYFKNILYTRVYIINQQPNDDVDENNSYEY